MIRSVAVAIAALLVLGGSTVSAAHAHAQGETCAATVVASLPNHLYGPWLDITGSGYHPGKTYAVFATMPNGYVEGVSVFSADGTWETTSLPGYDGNFDPVPGLYSIRVRNLTHNGDQGSLLATCSVTE